MASSSSLRTLESSDGARDRAHEFTREWITQQLIPGLNGQLKDKKSVYLQTCAKKEFLSTFLYQPDVNENETLLVRLKLDYPFGTGWTLLAFLLDMIQHLRNRVDIFPLTRSRLTYFYRMILLNIKRNSYSRFEPFEDQGMEKLQTPAFTPLHSGSNWLHVNVLSLVVNQRCSVKPIPSYSKHGVLKDSTQARDDIAFLEWTEHLIQLLLNQPNVTTEIYTKLVNQRCLQSASQSLFSQLIQDVHLSLPICRSFLKSNADINLILLDRRDASPLYSTVLFGRVTLLIEMLLAQPDLTKVDLTFGQSDYDLATTVHTQSNTCVLSCVRTLLCVYPDSSKNIMKRTFHRLYQWQQEQLKQLETNANFQPNDAIIRDWLQQQLSSLPTQLWSDETSKQLEIHRISDTSDEDRSRLIDAWVKQLNHAPHLIHLLGSLTTSSSPLLVQCLDLFLTPQFRPLLPQIFDLFSKSNVSFVDDVIVLPYWSCILVALTVRLETISKCSDPIERMDQATIIFKFLTISFQRMNHFLEVYEEGTYLSNQDYLSQLKLAHGYERCNSELYDDLLTRSEKIAREIPQQVRGLIGSLGRGCPLDFFKELWLHHLPTLSFFRSNELKCYYEFLRALMIGHAQLWEKPSEATIERFQTFLSDPFFRTSDLFQPFQLLPSPSNFNMDVEGRTMIEQLIPIHSFSPNPARADSYLPFVKSLESDWLTIHTGKIRDNLEQYLIPDLSNLVLNYLKPPKSTAAAQSPIQMTPSFGAYSLAWPPNVTESVTTSTTNSSMNMSASSTSPPVAFTGWTQ